MGTSSGLCRCGRHCLGGPRPRVLPGLGPEQRLRGGGALLEAHEADEEQRQAGVIEVLRSDELLHVGETVALQPALAAGTGVAIVSDGGGQATLAVDALLAGAQAYFAAMAAAGLSQSAGANPEFEVSGDLGYEWNTYTVTDKSGKTVDTGKYLSVFGRRNGKWVIVEYNLKP